MIDFTIIPVNSNSNTTRRTRRTRRTSRKRRDSNGKTRYQRVSGKYKANKPCTKVTSLAIPQITTPMYSK